MDRRDALLTAWVAGRALAACVEETKAGAPPQRSSVAKGALIVTAFPRIADQGVRSSFTRTDRTTTFDWLTIAANMATVAQGIPDRLLNLLHALEYLDFGHGVNMLEHSLQTATRAQRAGASEQLVLAGLTHCLGMAIMVEGYAELSAALMREFVSAKTYEIIRRHPEYGADPFSAPRSDDSSFIRRAFADRAWSDDAVRFCDEWSRPSYDPDYDSLPLSAFEPSFRAAIALAVPDPYMTRSDCVVGL